MYFYSYPCNVASHGMKAGRPKKRMSANLIPLVNSAARFIGRYAEGNGITFSVARQFSGLCERVDIRTEKNRRCDGAPGLHKLPVVKLSGRLPGVSP